MQPTRPPRLSLVQIGILALVGIGLWLVFQDRRGPRLDPTAGPRVVAARGDLAADEQNTIDVFEQVSPSVVFITSIALRRDFFSLNVQEIPQGTGSGFVWDQEGRIVTNFHVIKDASRLEVTLADHSSWKATLVGAAPDKDVAVLQIGAPAAKLHPIPVGESGGLRVGQKVFAIGNPFGLDQSMSTGIVSALGREISSITGRAIHNVIQTDAAINPGNSGGPLLDSAGRLIGVNTMIYSPSGASAGIGFAVPVAEINRVVPQLIRHGRVVKPGLGVSLASDRINESLEVEGLLILRVAENSAGERAGLRPTTQVRGGIVLGDVIQAINDRKVRDYNELRDLIEEYKVGEEVTVTVHREGRQARVPVVLEAVE